MKVTLYPGPRLMLINEGIVSLYPYQKDITKKSINHLFDSLTIAPDVTLNDVFDLFKYCPELLHVYSDLTLKKLIEEIQSNLDPEACKANPYELGLRIYREWNYDSRFGTYFKHQNPCIKLHVWNENFGSDLAFCPIEDVLGVKLELFPHVFIMEMDWYSSRLGDIDATRKISYFSLGELLHSLQMSAYHMMRHQVRDEHLYEHDCAWDGIDDPEGFSIYLSEKLSRVRVIFKSDGGHPIDRIFSVVASIPDKVKAEKWLQFKLGKDVKLNRIYCRMNGWELRLLMDISHQSMQKEELS